MVRFYLLALAMAALSPCMLSAETLSPSSAHALSLLAPAGRWASRIEYRENGYRKLFDSRGRTVALGEELDQLTLDANVFEPLQVFGAGANLGVTSFSARVTVKRLEIILAYGVSENLTAGLIIPFGETRTHIAFDVTGGNIGFNPAFDPGQPVDAANFPFAPVGAGAAAPVGMAGVQTLLTDPVFGFAYQPLASTQWSGMGDPTLGFLWQFYSDAVSSLVFGAGIRIGLAEADNPDDLFDVPIDDGTNDARFRLEYYRDIGQGFDIKLQVERDVQMKDKVRKRVPLPGDFLAAATATEFVGRDLGNYWEYDIGVGKSLKDWRVGLTWHRYEKQADRYIAASGTSTQALEANTSLFANQWRASISWSGIHAWQQGDIPLPLIVQLELQETYSAKNFPDVRDVYLQLTSFF